MNTNILFSSISIDELKQSIVDAVKTEFEQALCKPKQEAPEFITRLEATKLLGITLPTLSAWTKEGLIPSYRIASRIRYKRTEVLNSLGKVRTKYNQS